MASVTNSGSSSSNMFYTSYGVKSKGIGGLASGLDTDSLVDALVSGTKSKIAAQGQKKQLLNWKVSAYRGVITAMNAYKNKYLTYSATSSTNLKSNAFFNTYKATSSSDKVSVTANSGSITGDFTIDYVGQLAKAATLTNTTKLSTDLAFGLEVGDTVSSATAFSGRVLQLDLDGSGTPKNIKLDSLNDFIVSDGSGGYKLSTSYYYVNGNGDKVDVSSPSEVPEGSKVRNTLEDEIQRLMTDAFGTKNIYNEDGSRKIATDAEGNKLYLDDEKTKPVYETANKVTASIKDGKIILDSDTSKISVYSDCTVLGIDKGETNRVNMSTKIGKAFEDAFKNLEGDVFKFTINGAEISVTKDDTLATLKTKIDSSNAGVRFDYDQNTDEFTLTAKSTGSGNTIDMRDTQGNLMNQLFGAQGGGGIGTNWLMSDTVPTSDNFMALFSQDGGWSKKDLAKNLSSLEFNLTIDGVTKTVKADTTKLNSTKLANGEITSQDIISAINAGIQKAFTGTSVKFEMEIEQVGELVNDNNERVDPDGRVLDDDEDSFYEYRYTGLTKMTAGEGVAYAATATLSGSNNALAVLGFTEKAIGNTVLDMGYSKKITAGNTYEGYGTDKAATLNGAIGGDISGTFSLTINGETKEIEIFKVTSDALNTALKNAFGSSIASQVKFSISGGKINIDTTDSNMAINVSNGSNVGQKKDIYEALGFTAATSNNVNSDTTSGITFGDLKGSEGLSGTLTFYTSPDDTEGVTVDYSTGKTLQSFLAEINQKLGDPNAATIVNGRLSIKSSDGYMKVEDSGNLLEKYFGLDGEYETVGADPAYESNYVRGQDAEIVVNGKTLTSTTNNFTINGATVTLNSVSNPGDKPITVSVKSDPNDVVDRLKSWIEDYNGLIATLNTMIYEGKNNDYSPLTDEQKAEMTDEQIKTWETEAKKGILRNDQTLAKIVNDLRTEMYNKVEAAGISLFDIGITTKGYSYSDITQSGQLEISDENKLRSMLEKDADKVRLLFTDSEDGLATRMESIIAAATNTSSVDRGSLVSLAGTEMLTGDNTSTLGKQLTSIDDYISKLKTRLQSEYNRYWSRFTALETAIQKMNSQSTMFSS